MQKSLALLIVAFVATGCATVERVAQTPSGKPEVFLMAVEREDARDRLVNDLLNRGWTPVGEVTSYTLTFRKDPQGFGETFAAEMIAGGQYRGEVEMRVNFTILGLSDGTRIVSDYPYLTSKHAIFGTENRHVLDTNRMFNDIHTMLQGLQLVDDLPLPDQSPSEEAT